MPDDDDPPGCLPPLTFLVGIIAGGWVAWKAAGFVAGLVSSVLAAILWVVVAVATFAVVALIVWVLIVGLVEKVRSML